MPLRRRARFLVAPVLIALAIASLASGCASTFQYRALQSRFMEALSKAMAAPDKKS